MGLTSGRYIKWGLVSIALAGVIYGVFSLLITYGFLTIFGDVKDQLRYEECFGIITAINQAPDGNTTISVMEKNNMVKLSVSTCGTTKDFWKFTEIGDTIEKKKGMLKVKVIKQGTRETKEFEYPVCLY